MVEVEKVGVLSLAKFYSVLMALIGGIFALIFGTMLAIVIGIDSLGLGVITWILSLIGGIIGYAIIGFIMGIIGALLYNIVASISGGIELKLRD